MTFTREQLIAAFQRWSNACDQADGKFVDTTVPPAEVSADTLIRFLNDGYDQQASDRDDVYRWFDPSKDGEGQ